MITVIANLKGGSGKSTVTFNLAVWLCSQQKTVQTYDLDPQATLIDVIQVRKEEGYQPTVPVKARYSATKDKVDEILVDIGTANSKAMDKALKEADRVIIPVPPSQADIWSTQRFLYRLASLKRETPLEVITFINRADTHAAVKESNQAEEALQQLPAIKVLSQRLCQRTNYRRSFSEGLAVFELEPSSKAAKEFLQFAEAVYPA